MTQRPNRINPIRQQNVSRPASSAGRPVVRDPIRPPAQTPAPAPANQNVAAGAAIQESDGRTGEISLDIYRSHTPYSFVVIGGQVAQVRNFDLTKNDRPAEPGDASIDISLDAIDSAVFANFLNKGDLIPVEIWCGYLTDSLSEEDQAQQIEEIKASILQEGGKKNRTVDEQGREIFVIKKQRKFAQRFSGYVSLPEWTVGNTGKMINLKCRDWLGYLQEFKFYDDLRDAQCTVSNIINRFNKEIKGLEFSIEPADRGNYSMANPDSEDGKKVFSAKGKSYQNILSEICDRLGLKVFISGNKVKLRYRVRSPFIWKYYHGLNSGILPSGEPLGTPFDEVKIRFGVFGQVETTRDFIVEVTGFLGAGSGKKAADRKVVVRMPENQQPTAGTQILRVSYPYGPTDDKDKIKMYAEKVYREKASRKVTMSLKLGFANPFLDLYDAVEFVGDGSDDALDFVKSKWFEITSISESYNESGYSQMIEGRNNIAYQKAFEVIPIIPPRTTNSDTTQTQVGLSAQIQPPPS